MLFKRALCNTLTKLDFRLYPTREAGHFSNVNRKIREMSQGKRKGCAKEPKAKNPPKKSHFPPGEMYLTVLGNGSKSSSRSLYMFTDHGKYLFNCGEGTQRLASEHKMKLSKLEHVFITHKSWENIGGLLGLSLTIQDMGVSEVTIHGPPEIDSLYRHTESFVFLPKLNIATKSYSDEPFKDECMEVQYIPIFKSQNSGILKNSENNDDASTIEHKSKKLRVDEQDADFDVTMAFVCKGHSKLGHIQLDKCVEFGVPIGPLLGDLKNGKDVTLPSGKVVLSKDVVTEEEVCPRFLVVECPSEEFLEPFVKEDKFRLYQEDESFVAALVVHFTPGHILNTPQYQEWIQRFPSTTSHLILNDDCPSLNSFAVHRLQHHLNLLHPDIFTLLQEDDVNEISTPKDNVIHARTLERYYLRPAKGLERSFGIKIEPSEFVEEALKLEDFCAKLKDLECNIKNTSKNCNKELYPEVSFLGTGSSIPNKARNVSAILVHTSEKKCLLMDCGEGTYGQLLRLYREQYKDILLQLNCIFISHMHADHHLGVVRILKERQELFKSLKKDCDPVFLIGPGELDPWLKNYYRDFESTTPLYRFSECSDLAENIFIKSQDNIENHRCKDVLITTVPVTHCKDAHGVVISSKLSGWKIVYSGDTVPCKRLISAGKDCSLLIHEATMEDELASEASFKRHSTTSQAIKVAEEMNAEHTILTHFSQRYAKVPIFNENFHNRVGCAFDNMKVRPSQYHILPLLIPALNSLFADHIEELQTKTDKRRKREELLKKMVDESLTEIKCTNKS